MSNAPTTNAPTITSMTPSSGVGRDGCDRFRSQRREDAFSNPSYLAAREFEQHFRHKRMPVLKLIPLCQPCARRKVLLQARQAPWTTRGQHRDRILAAYAREWGEVIEPKKWEVPR